jgi:hypothetical protein
LKGQAGTAFLFVVDHSPAGYSHARTSPGDFYSYHDRRQAAKEDIDYYRYHPMLLNALSGELV